MVISMSNQNQHNYKTVMYLNLVPNTEVRKLKPWHWTKRLVNAKRKYKDWETNRESAISLYKECTEIYNEIQSNFDVSHHYFKEQAEACKASYMLAQDCVEAIGYKPLYWC